MYGLSAYPPNQPDRNFFFQSYMHRDRHIFFTGLSKGEWIYGLVFYGNQGRRKGFGDRY